MLYLPLNYDIQWAEAEKADSNPGKTGPLRLDHTRTAQTREMGMAKQMVPTQEQQLHLQLHKRPGQLQEQGLQEGRPGVISVL